MTTKVDEVSEQVERLDPCSYGQGEVMRARKDGDYVSYEDYEKLQAEAADFSRAYGLLATENAALRKYIDEADLDDLIKMNSALERLLRYHDLGFVGSWPKIVAQIIKREREQRQRIAELEKDAVILVSALKQISAIEDKYNCDDWHEINEAREIAGKALLSASAQAKE